MNLGYNATLQEYEDEMTENERSSEAFLDGVLEGELIGLRLGRRGAIEECIKLLNDHGYKLAADDIEQNIDKEI